MIATPIIFFCSAFVFSITIRSINLLIHPILTCYSTEFDNYIFFGAQKKIMENYASILAKTFGHLLGLSTIIHLFWPFIPFLALICDVYKVHSCSIFYPAKNLVKQNNQLKLYMQIFVVVVVINVVL